MTLLALFLILCLSFWATTIAWGIFVIVERIIRARQKPVNPITPYQVRIAVLYNDIKALTETIADLRNDKAVLEANVKCLRRKLSRPKNSGAPQQTNAEGLT